jgi:uncharacterized protein (DUF305 family)
VLWIGIGLACIGLASAAAQETQHHAAGSADGAEPAGAAYIAASDRMHQDMAVAFSGDPDVDFVRAMIPHHQGAIDMARAVLEYGQDGTIRVLAEAIIREQETEIALLRAWLERNARAD